MVELQPKKTRAELSLSFVQSVRRNEMKCQRCGNDKEAEFRVVSDILDMKVCADCAAEARRIGLSLEIVAIDAADNDRAASNDGRQRRGGKIPTGSKHRRQTQRRVA
jgi:hypothetical protein